MAEKEWLFDRKWTQEFTRVRQEFMGSFLRNVQKQYELRTALDLGCGVGYFSNYLRTFGFEVVAVDGREENAAEARRRHPEIEVLCRDIEDSQVADLGVFDFVACIGLLYHLENPFRAIRNIFALTGKVLLIETMSSPHRNATMDLLDEGVGEDQALQYVAFYPSEACFVKMLYRAGYPFVYRFRELPNDALFRTTLVRKRQRTFLTASKMPLSAPNLVLAREQLRLVGGDLDPWTTRLSRPWRALFQVRVVAAKILRPARGPAGEKSK
jgi:SAM-dependent methyltransferase